MKKLCEDAAMAMYREGRLDREIAEAIGYSRVSVTNWRNNRGLPPNRGQKPKKMLDAYKAAMPLERVQELAQAEKDGRLVVLPCKVGDMVWCISRAHKAISPYTVAGYLNDGFRWKVRMTKTIPSWVGNKTEHKYAAFNAFGKTVFLTREEAEAALKKREADNEAD